METPKQLESTLAAVGLLKAPFLKTMKTSLFSCFGRMLECRDVMDTLHMQSPYSLVNRTLEGSGALMYPTPGPQSWGQGAVAGYSAQSKPCR